MVRQVRRREHPEFGVRIPVDGLRLEGILSLPQRASGLVIFAHGSGSSRLSPRNRFVAEALGQARLATLLLDLLTREEERVDEVTAHLRFDIDRLAARVVAATDWVVQQPPTRGLKIGYFGASTGAAAALIAAGARPDVVGAVVSRGGRPDLARDALEAVQAPTLFIVGAHDFGVIELNEMALHRIASPYKELRLVPNATHLFEEPGALPEVARAARSWFERYLIA